MKNLLKRHLNLTVYFHFHDSYGHGIRGKVDGPKAILLVQQPGSSTLFLYTMLVATCMYNKALLREHWN